MDIHQSKILDYHNQRLILQEQLKSLYCKRLECVQQRNIRKMNYLYNLKNNIDDTDNVDTNEP